MAVGCSLVLYLRDFRIGNGDGLRGSALADSHQRILLKIEGNLDELELMALYGVHFRAREALSRQGGVGYYGDQRGTAELCFEHCFLLFPWRISGLALGAPRAERSLDPRFLEGPADLDVEGTVERSLNEVSGFSGPEGVCGKSHPEPRYVVPPRTAFHFDNLRESGVY